MEQSIEDTTRTSSPNNERPSSVISIGSTTSTNTPTERLTPAARRREASRQKDRTKDIEFAAEIGQGLLLEVRRLQGELHEKLERIKELETDKADLERAIEGLNRQLRNNRDTEDSYKQDIFDLEITRQELTSKVDELQQQLDKAKLEYLKIEKALATATDVIEQLKDKQDKLAEALENSKNRHEKDLANNRRHVAALNREKNDLKKNLEEVKTQYDNLLASKNIRKRGDSQDIGTDSETGGLLNSDTSAISPTSSSALPGGNLSKDDVLKALNTANRMIGGLRANLQKEKSEKYELKKLLADSQEQIENLQNESEFQGGLDYANNAKFNRYDESGGSDDDYDYDDDDDIERNDKNNKNNRPSSGMFNDASIGASIGTSIELRKEFRSVEVQTEEFLSPKENGYHNHTANSDLVSKSVGVQTEEIPSQKENALHNHTTSSSSISTNSSRTSTDQISRQVGSSNIGSGSGVGGGRTIESNNHNEDVTATDPNIIGSITRTMIGESLWKYYRSNFGGGILEKRHKRFFWIHPYSKTLYWSSKNPAILTDIDSKSKSGLSHFALIKSIHEVQDHNSSPAGLYHMSLVVETTDREIKMTAPTKEVHDLWYQGLKYLLQGEDSEQNGNSSNSNNNNSRSILNPWDNQVDMSTDNEENYDDLENVRQCCDGKHDVSKLDKPHKPHKLHKRGSNHPHRRSHSIFQ